MPTGFYIRTKKYKHSEKSKRNMSEAHLKSFREGLVPWNKGKTGLKGTPHTEESKRKLSIANKGKRGWNKGLHHSEITRQRISQSNIGKKVSPETRKKQSLSAMGKHTGEKSPLWRGGKMANYSEYERVRKSMEYRLWRKSCFERDVFTCQKCKDNKGGNLIVHHINNFADFPELRLAIDNGITFCGKCHDAFHDRFGKRNNTREQLQEFLSV